MPKTSRPSSSSHSFVASMFVAMLITLWSIGPQEGSFSVFSTSEKSWTAIEFQASDRVSFFHDIGRLGRPRNVYVSEEVPISTVDVHPVFLQTISGIETLKIVKKDDLVLVAVQSAYMNGACEVQKSETSRLGSWEIVRCPTIHVDGSSLYIFNANENTVAAY